MKKGTKVKVYGGAWQHFSEKVSANENLFYFHGREATVVYFNEDELGVKFKKQKPYVRHPVGIWSVHPKQCRKVRV